MADIAYIKKFKSEDPLRAVGNVEDHNRIANILNTIEGIGCRFVKDLHSDGRGWKIIVGDGTSDGDAGYKPPSYYDITNIYNLITGGSYGSLGINKTFYFKADSATSLKILDDTIDYRGRHIECWLELSSANLSSTPSVAQGYFGS